MKYLGMITGGLGPDVWDHEIEIDAADFKDASEQAIAQAEERGGQVVYLEQNDDLDPIISANLDCEDGKSAR